MPEGAEKSQSYSVDLAVLSALYFPLCSLRFSFGFSTALPGLNHPAWEWTLGLQPFSLRRRTPMIRLRRKDISS